ncbi:histone acetyltransferase type B catalytic subunit isoform X1 [Hydra vulgaris]|uniref:histone acetyltransferase type B catalytic subunit isoform X1 n=1 Tax=Hydra vulgaris TaxID=6087 RepID=UPI001F5F947F|nr:histone acetyltransferase type B catalytic subunit [Hydra vulgaris]
MAVGTGIEGYKCDANDVLSIKLVHSEEDVIGKEGVFHPMMSHQVFGESETIFGYKGLNIQLYYHAGSLLTYLNMEYHEQIPRSYGIKPDPVIPKIVEQIPQGFISNRDEFISKLEKEDSFTPMGNKIHSYFHDDTEYEIYEADIFTPRLKEYHERLQTFILWYIDAASFIDIDDEKWHFFLLFEKKKSIAPIYNIVGYMTVYHYYSYPDKFRPRISQTLILPPFQRKGHCVQLLHAVNKHYISNPDAVDITVEDPSEDFVRCRDFVDCQNCLKLNSFSKDKLLTDYSDDMRKDALEKFKITKSQARRVYEILRLRVTDISNNAMYHQYRLCVKKRLNLPFQKQARDMEKLRAVLSSEEYNSAMVGQSNEERIQRLDEAYKLLEAEYFKVIDRLD